MSEQHRKVAIITGGSQGIGAGPVAEYRRLGWAVVATSRTIKLSGDPAVLTVDGDTSQATTTDRIINETLGHFGRKKPPHHWARMTEHENALLFSK